MVNPIAAHFSPRLFPSPPFDGIESMKKKEVANVTSLHPMMEIGLERMGDQKGRSHSETREADRIYLEKRARCNEARDSRDRTGVDVRSLVDAADEKRKVVPSPYLVARCAYIRSNHGRLFKLFARRRDERIFLRSRSEPRAKNWGECFIFLTLERLASAR